MFGAKLSWCQIVRCQIVLVPNCLGAKLSTFIILVPNCPGAKLSGAKLSGAKLSWCQIVRCQIVLVPNCPGGKLSTFIILVPNCLFLLSWCQIVCFYYLGAKLSALLSWCQIVRCQIVLQSCKQHENKKKLQPFLLQSCPSSLTWIWHFQSWS